MPDAHNTPDAPRVGSPIPRASVAIFAALIAAMFVVGSVADFSISQSLYAPENAFGVVLAAYGEAPALLALVAAGSLAMTARPPVHIALRWLLLLGGAGLIIVGTLALVIRPEEYWALPVPVRMLVALALAAGVIWATRAVSAGATWQAMCVVAAALFAVVAAEMVLVQGVKILWERPRMRMLTETGADFTPWWSPGYESKETLISQGVEASEFKSFPSGHTANAATAMMLTGFALLRADLRRYAPALFWIGALWALAVAGSRITMGAHFLTDTATGLLVSYACVLIVLTLASAALNRRVLDGLERPPRAPDAVPRHGRSDH